MVVGKVAGKGICCSDGIIGGLGSEGSDGLRVEERNLLWCEELCGGPGGGGDGNGCVSGCVGDTLIKVKGRCDDGAPPLLCCKHRIFIPS